MKTLLFSNWTFLRAIRLLLGVAFILSASMQMQIIPAVIGGLFIYQSLANVGCAGGACYTPTAKQSSHTATRNIEDKETK